jgi:hypothetical protein
VERKGERKKRETAGKVGNEKERSGRNIEKMSLGSVLRALSCDVKLRFIYEVQQRIKQNCIARHAVKKGNSNHRGIYRSWKSDSPSTSAMRLTFQFYEVGKVSKIFSDPLQMLLQRAWNPDPY